MTTFGDHLLIKLNKWLHEEAFDYSVRFIEDNGTILVQTDREYIGIVYWIGTDILVISIHPTHEYHQSIKLFLLRTLSAFLRNVTIRCLHTVDTTNI